MASKTISTILNLKDNFSSTIQGITKNTQSFKKGMKNTEDQALSMRDKVSNAYDTISQSVLHGIGFGAGMDIWDTMKKGIVETVTFSSNLQKSLNGVKSATGITDEALNSMRNTMLDIYNDNFGEGFEDIGDAIKTISQQTGVSGDALKDLAENAFALRDTFGYDVSESVRSANTLMKQFGINGTEAFNLIAQGQQNGLDYSGELLDSINEYSVQFNKLGLSAEDMFNILADGSADGAFNLDKIGDAVKEFSIRVIDGSNTTIDGFTKLGLNVNDMTKKFSAGGDTAKDAFKQVTKAIGGMDDPVQQSIVGVDLFGTMWEDLGSKVVTGLGNIGDEFNSTIDSINQIKDINFNDVGSAFQYIKRNIQTAILIPIGDQVLPRLNNFAKWFGNNIPGIKENISSITNTFLDIGSSIGNTVFPSIVNLGSSIGDLASTIYNSIVPAFSSVTPENWNSVGDAISGIIDGASSVFNFINDNWPTIEPIVISITGTILAWKAALIAVDTWSAIVTVTTSAWATIEMIIWGIKNATTAWEAAQFALNVVMDANPIGAVTLLIAGLGVVIYKVVTHWQDICTWTQNAWDKLTNNPIADFILSVNPFTGVLYNIAKHFDDITSAISKAWDWLTSWNDTDAEDKNLNVNKNITTTTTTDGAAVTVDVGHNATGTQYWRGGKTIVGEYGPELVTLPGGSKVSTASQTQKDLGGQDIKVYVTVQGNVIGNESFIDQLGNAVWNKVNLAIGNS